MSKSWVICVVVCAYVSVIQAGEFGYGRLEVLAINKCEQESHKFKFDLESTKINETHFGCSGHVILDEEFTDEFGMRLDICKYVDDGCKQVLVLAEASLYDFFNTYIEDELIRQCFASTGIDPPEIPIPAGEYDLNEYVYELLPMTGMYGSFNVKTSMMKEDEEIGCIECLTRFYEIPEEDEPGEK